MAKLVKGPFSIQWGSNPILDVSELGFNYDVATNDYETIQVLLILSKVQLRLL